MKQMRPDFNLKIFRVFLIPGLFILLNINGICQTSQSKETPDFKYRIESSRSGGETIYTVKVTIIKGQGPFSVGVYENLKEEMVELDKEENVIGSATLSFTGKKACVIYVRNSQTGTFKTLKY